MTETQVYLGIGSNIDRESNIQGALEEIQSCYGQLTISPVYECEAFGFKGDDFFNLVVGLKTEIPIEELAHDLREIEYQFGRHRNETRYSSRTVDIDLLLYGDGVYDAFHVPRSDITEFGFVLKPLCDIAPDLKHPVIGKTIMELWDKFDSSREVMRPASIEFSL